jgi:transcription elongation factor GreA
VKRPSEKSWSALKKSTDLESLLRLQSFAEGRIKELEYKLSNSQVIDITTLAHSGRVLFGATVDLINVDDDTEVSYRIVGEDEADVKQNMISVSSPIARALVGKSEGDEVVVKAPGGDIYYEIDKVRHV